MRVSISVCASGTGDILVVIYKPITTPRKRGNVGTNLQKMTGSEHSELIHEFEAMTTNQDGILGELENAVGAFDAKMVLSWIFQVLLI